MSILFGTTVAVLSRNEVVEVSCDVPVHVRIALYVPVRKRYGLKHSSMVSDGISCAV